MTMPEESKVGKKLSDLTTKRLIIVVLAMLFSVPIFDPSTYVDSPSADEYGLYLLASYEYNSESFNRSWDWFILDGMGNPAPLVLLSAYNRTWESESVEASTLRSNEQEISSILDGEYVAVGDLRKEKELDAGLGIGTTLFVCVVLATAAIIFSQLTNSLVINPIEEMIIKVNKISQNPLLAA